MAVVRKGEEPSLITRCGLSAPFYSKKVKKKKPENPEVPESLVGAFALGCYEAALHVQRNERGCPADAGEIHRLISGIS